MACLPLVQSSKSQRNNVRRVQVMVNGNVKVPAKPFLLDPRLYPTMDRLYDALGRTLLPEFGAVHSIYDARECTAVTAVSGLVADATYVIVGRGRFKPLNYLGVLDYAQRQKNFVPQVKQRSASKRGAAPETKPAPAGVQIDQPCQILIVRNGDSSGDSTRLLLQKRDRTRFEKVMDAVSRKMQCSVRSLYTLGGQEVRTLDGIHDVKEGGIYVAVVRPPFVSPNLRVDSGGKLRKKPQPRTLQPLGKDARKGGRISLRTPVKMRPVSETWAGGREMMDEQKSRLVLSLLLEEEAVELMHEVLEGFAAAAARLQQGLAAHHTMLQGLDITHEYDALVGDIIDRFMNPAEAAGSDERFREPMEAALEGKLQHWEPDPQGLVALVILLDQMPRALHKGSAKAFAYDDAAMEVMRRAYADNGAAHEVGAHFQIVFAFVLSHQVSRAAGAPCPPAATRRPEPPRGGA